MLFNRGSLYAATAFALWYVSLSSAGSIPSRSLRGRNLPRDAFDNGNTIPSKRSGETILVSQSDIEQLQTDFDAFQSWMTQWFAAGDTSASAVSVLQQEITAYEGWMTSWLSAAESSSTVGGSSPTACSGSTSVSTTVSTTSTSSPTTASTTSTSLTSTSTSTTSSLPTTTGSYTFDPQASTNVAVYYAQTPTTNDVTLEQLCQEDAIDIVILAFVDELYAGGGYPGVNFGGACDYDQTAEMQSAGATGLLYCPTLASQITTCQGIGKKVMLSIGGATSTSSFANDTEAASYSELIWSLFGGGSSVDPGLRPFGSVKVDGFDVDNEDNIQTGWTSFVTNLRALFPSDSSKTYYLSAAPQCPIPDASTPLDAMLDMDFIWVQFYDNTPCNVGTSGFIDSFEAWSSLLDNGTHPRLYIGEIAFAAGSGYLAASDMQAVVEQAKAVGIPNFGGVMLWDGSEAYENGHYEEAMKSALTS